jgi:ABC-type transport system involved in multi-copper enzyme maturation permease subunit
MQPVPGGKTVSQFFSVVHHEFNLSVRRPGFWIAYILISVFYLISILIPSMDGASDLIGAKKIWSEAGHLVFMFNLFMPLLAGILSADRMQRDFRTGMRELQRSTPVSIPVYILAKYLGVLASVLLPMFLLVLCSGGVIVAKGLAPIGFLWPLLLAFLAIAVPAHAFVVAFSLACPLVLPIRVYQVLFTGYWFWGNMLSPKAFPTISDTVLNAVGQYPLQAYFDVTLDSTGKVTNAFTPPQAVLNLIVLLGCIALTLFALDRYLRYQERAA